MFIRTRALGWGVGAILSVSLAVLGAPVAGASTASACASIRALGSPYASTSTQASAAGISVAISSVNKDRAAISRIVAETPQAVVKAGFRTAYVDLTDESRALLSARAKTRARASRSSIAAQISLANKDNTEAKNALSGLSSRVISMCAKAWGLS